MKKKELLQILAHAGYPEWRWVEQNLSFIHGDSKSAKDEKFTAAQIEPNDLMGVSYLEEKKIKGLEKHVTPDPFIKIISQE